MNQQNQGSGSPSNTPAKRKRGRPRKEGNTVQTENMPVRRGSDNVINLNQKEGTTGSAGNEMLGKVVTGVIDGCFGAGYLINVGVEDSLTCLRGVVFQPGRFVPVTPENDVAPHLEMLQRKDFPIPIINPLVQMQSPMPLSGQVSKQPVDPNPLVPISKDQVLPTMIHSGALVSLENQSAAVLAPMTNIPKNDSSISIRGIPQTLSDPGHGSRSASTMKTECDKTVEQDANKLDTSRPVKEPSVDGGAEKDSKPAAEDMDLLPTTENIDKELQTGQHSRSSVHQLNEQIQDEPKISDVELNQMPIPVGAEPIQSEQIQDELKHSSIEVNQTPVFAGPELMQTEQIQEEPKNSNVEVNQLPVSVEPEALQSEEIHDEPKNSNMELNEMPASSEPESNPTEQIQKLKNPSSIQLKQMPVYTEPEDVQYVDKLVDQQDSPKPPLGQPSTVLEGDALPSECRSASETSNLPDISDPRSHGPSGETTKEDESQPSDSSVKSVEPENPIGPDIF